MIYIRCSFPYVDTNVFPLSKTLFWYQIWILFQRIFICAALLLDPWTNEGKRGVTLHYGQRVIDLFAVFHQTPASMSYQTMYIFIFNMDIDLDVIAMYLIRVSLWRALLLEWPQKVFRPFVWVVSRGRLLLIKSHNWYRA